jgi:hypothetical protein
VKICCFSKCGVVMEEFNPHLPFGDHLLGNFFYFCYRENKVFYIFHCLYYRWRCLKKWLSFQFRFRRGTLESSRGLRNWCHKNYRTIYKLWRRRIMKQDELDDDSKFTTIIAFWRQIVKVLKEKQKSWKWKGVCGN